MVAFYILEPEVPGGVGPNTRMDTGVHPPRVSHLHYVFEGWLGDELVESFPCWMVTESLAARIADAKLYCGELCDAEATAAGLFRWPCSTYFFRKIPVV
jgi:hypothetical protein